MENEFAPLFEEIVQQDCYRLRSVPFQPDVIFDIGASVGVFTSYARFLFPKARIYAVEPDDRNYGLLLQHTEHLPNVTHWKAALATGPVYRRQPPEIRRPYFNGTAQYVNEGSLGFPEGTLAGNETYESTSVPHFMLDCIFGNRVAHDQKILCKIDIEGNETCIFNHAPSMVALRRVDYLAMEIHYDLDGTGPVWEDGKPTIRQCLARLEKTHRCEWDGPHNLFFATRKEIK